MISIKDRDSNTTKKVPLDTWSTERGFTWSEISEYLKKPTEALKQLPKACLEYWSPSLRQRIIQHFQASKKSALPSTENATPSSTPDKNLSSRTCNREGQNPIPMSYEDYYLVNYGPTLCGYALFNRKPLASHTPLGLYIGQSWFTPIKHIRQCRIKGHYAARTKILPGLYLYTDAHTHRNYTAFITDLPDARRLTARHFYRAHWLQEHIATANIQTDIILTPDQKPAIMLLTKQDIPPDSLLGFDYGRPYLNTSNHAQSSYKLSQQFYTKTDYTPFPAVFFRKATQKKLVKLLLSYLKDFQKTSDKLSHKTLFGFFLRRRIKYLTTGILQILPLLAIDAIKAYQALFDKPLFAILLEHLDILAEETQAQPVWKSKFFLKTHPQQQLLLNQCISHPVTRDIALIHHRGTLASALMRL